MNVNDGGFEPAASAVTVLRCKKHHATTNEFERHDSPVFMHLWPWSVVCELMLNDTTRYPPIRVGMGGLRHKLRHKSSSIRRPTLPAPLCCPARIRGKAEGTKSDDLNCEVDSFYIDRFL